MVVVINLTMRMSSMLGNGIVNRSFSRPRLVTIDKLALNSVG